jgi:hypothetical protein
VGEDVLLKLNPNKILLKLGICTKLEHIFYGPFEILDRIELVGYILSFLSFMNVHNLFHVSLLKNYVHDPNHVIDWNLIYVEPEGYF